MDLDFNGDVTCLDAELLQLQEVSPLAIKANPYVAEKLYDQWLSLPETHSLVITLFVLFSYRLVSTSMFFFRDWVCSSCVVWQVRLANVWDVGK